MVPKTNREIIEAAAHAVSHLYETEGRSKAYIARVLGVDRGILTKYINEKALVQANVYHPTPSTVKSLKRNKQLIINMLDADATLDEISEKTKLPLGRISRTFRKLDKEIAHHFEAAESRRKNRAEDSRDRQTSGSARDYTGANSLPGEIWKPILGYEKYEVSNLGRVRAWTARYKKPYLLKPNYIPRLNRDYVHLYKDGKRTALSLARLVAHTFVPGYSETANTVNHKDRDTRNNKADNLEWLSQSDNNKHAFKTGKDAVIAHSRNGDFRKIILDGSYEFSTIRALAKFLKVSETQAARYINGECKLDRPIIIIY